MKTLGNFLRHPLTWLCAVPILVVLSLEYYPIILRGLIEDAMRKSLSTETFTKQMPTKLESLDLKSKPLPTPSFTEQATPKLD